MRTLIASLLATVLALPIAVARPGSGPITGQQAKAHIAQRLQHSSKVPDKTQPFATHLGGNKGDAVRPFTASNIRHMTVAGSYLTVGNTVTGNVNMKTGAVRTTGVTAVKSGPFQPR